MNIEYSDRIPRSTFTMSLMKKFDDIEVSAATDAHAVRQPRARKRPRFFDETDSNDDEQSEEVAEEAPEELTTKFGVDSDDDVDEEADPHAHAHNSNSNNTEELCSTADRRSDWSTSTLYTVREACELSSWRDRITISGPNERRSSRGNASLEHLTETDWYCQFRTDSDRRAEVESINIYVMKLQNMDEAERPPYVSEDRPWPPLYLKSWRNLTVREYQLFEGLVLAQTVLRLPRHRDYWAAKWPYRAPFHGLMTRDRFEAIFASLHFVPELRKPAGEDCLYKVQPLIDRLRSNCREVYRVGSEVSADEGVICIESKKISSSVRYYKLPKPIGEGVVLEIMAEAKSIDVTMPGYVQDFEVRRKKEPILQRWIRLMERNNDV